MVHIRKLVVLNSYRQDTKINMVIQSLVPIYDYKQRRLRNYTVLIIDDHLLFLLRCKDISGKYRDR